ncbi:hypothetical protein IQ07DRAFT_627111 [Pyrenochaeta sp. DS3sAY3a]|nr:hypothetical protein IQ07DRAFT_627111 [Pyrenochaeta sp. DS3sAY3a]
MRSRRANWRHSIKSSYLLSHQPRFHVDLLVSLEKLAPHCPWVHTIILPLIRDSFELGMSSSRVPEIQIWEPDSKADRTSQQDRESDTRGIQKGSPGVAVGSGARPYIPDVDFPNSPKDVNAGTVAEVTIKAEPIFNLAWDCDELLTKCLDEAREEELTTEPIVEQYQRSFDAWWKYLGVFAEKDSNLDRRLRKKPAIHDLVVRLLLILKDSLAQLFQISLTAINRTNITDPFTINKHVLESIEETLEDLSRVAFAIRKSGKVTETARARAFTSERPEVDAYEVLCSISLELLFQNAPESLLLQLCQSMVNRYARHLFRAPRQRVLDQDLRQPARSDTLRKDLIPAADILLPTSFDTPIHSRNETRSTLANAPISSIDSVKFQNYRSQQNILKVHKSSNSRSGTTIILGNIKEPPIPSFEGKLQTQCEWCFRPLGREVVENGKWSAIGRDHYRKDLEPYPCIWQSCSKGAPDFSSMRDWTVHMLQHHQNWTKHAHSQALWKCSLEMLNPEAHQKGHPADCATCTSPYTHESATYFASADHFLGHVRTVHKTYTEDWTESDFTTLSEESMIQMVLSSDVCPICYLIPTDLEASGPKSLQNHIVGHLQIVMLLSLRLLQYPEGHPEDKEDGKSTVIAEDASSRAGEDPNENTDDNESLSPFPSPSLLPHDTVTPHDDEKERSEAWEILAGDVLQDKRSKMETEFDPVLNHIKLASEMKPPKPFTVPFQRNLKFVGRHAELQALEDNFSAGTPSVQTIIGLGGMGKTELALELAFRIRSTYPDCSVLWLRATNVESLQRSLEMLTQLLSLPGCEYEHAKHLNLLLAYLSHERSGLWLLIIDGLDDQNVLGDGDVFSPRNRGQVVLTTRNFYVRAGITKKVIRVRNMDEKEASLLLESRLEQRPSLEEIQHVTDNLDHIPLAIIQAAAYINAHKITPKDYLSLFLEQEETIVAEVDSMSRTWTISFESIRETETAAFHLLAYISCLESKHEVPLGLLPADESPGSLGISLMRLRAYSMIEWVIRDHTLKIHRLVSLAVQKWMKSLNEWDDLVAYVMVRLEEAVSSCDTADLATCSKIMPHVIYIVGLRETNHLNERMSLLHWLGRCKSNFGDFKSAENAYRLLIEQEIRVLGKTYPDTLKSFDNLGLTLIEQGRKDEARNIFMEVWRQRKETLGSEHPDTLASARQLTLLDDDEKLLETSDHPGSNIDNPFATYDPGSSIDNPFALYPSSSSIDNPFASTSVLTPTAPVNRRDLRTVQDTVRPARGSQAQYNLNKRGNAADGDSNPYARAQQATRAISRAIGYEDDYEDDSDEDGALAPSNIRRRGRDKH